MAVIHHQRADDVCLHCLDPWPCGVAVARRELADWLWAQPLSPQDTYGVEWAVDAIRALDEPPAPPKPRRKKGEPRRR